MRILVLVFLFVMSFLLLANDRCSCQEKKEKSYFKSEEYRHDLTCRTLDVVNSYGFLDSRLIDLTPPQLAKLRRQFKRIYQEIRDEDTREYEKYRKLQNEACKDNLSLSYLRAIGNGKMDWVLEKTKGTKFEELFIKIAEYHKNLKERTANGIMELREVLKNTISPIQAKNLYKYAAYQQAMSHFNDEQKIPDFSDDGFINWAVWIAEDLNKPKHVLSGLKHRTDIEKQKILQTRIRFFSETRNSDLDQVKLSAKQKRALTTLVRELPSNRDAFSDQILKEFCRNDFSLIGFDFSPSQKRKLLKSIEKDGTFQKKTVDEKVIFVPVKTEHFFVIKSGLNRSQKEFLRRSVSKQIKTKMIYNLNPIYVPLVHGAVDQKPVSQLKELYRKIEGRKPVWEKKYFQLVSDGMIRILKPLGQKDRNEIEAIQGLRNPIVSYKPIPSSHSNLAFEDYFDPDGMIQGHIRFK